MPMLRVHCTKCRKLVPTDLDVDTMNPGNVGDGTVST